MFGVLKLSRLIRDTPAALIILKGDIPKNSLLTWLWKSCDKKIAADGACNFLLKKQLVPDITIGDLDSISKKNLKNINSDSILAIEDQNQTDSQKAFNYVIGLKTYSTLHVCALMGSRLDHVLYNLYLIKELKKKFPSLNIFVWTEQQLIFLTNKPIIIDGFLGSKISVIAEGQTDAKISTKGFEYELSQDVIQNFGNFSVSNKLKSNLALLEVKSKYTTVILEHKSFFVNLI